jgi:hypothetical protein
MTDNDLTNPRGRWPRPSLGEDDTARAIREIEAEHALEVESSRTAGMTQLAGRALVYAALAIAALLVTILILRGDA